MHNKEENALARAWVLPAMLTAAAALVGATSALAIVTSLGEVDELHDPVAEHVDQADLTTLVQAGHGEEAFETAFDAGDELFEVTFNALDGVGANVGDGQRFTRVPRADLDGPGEWRNHFPARSTGPNAQACNQCHLQPFDDGAGTAALAAHRDPLQSADLGSMIRRDVPHIFGAGALQRLAEEMTEELHGIRGALGAQVCETGRRQRVDLWAKGLSFGSLSARPRRRRGDRSGCRARFDTRNLTGVADDLVVRPYQWKGENAFLRDFNRGASHNELGMQPVEIVGDGVDGDFDGVVGEMTIGDQTALAIYLAAQPRPTTKLELDDLGLLDEPLTDEERGSIILGSQVFVAVGCADCHQSELTIDIPVFSEPSLNANYRDAVFPAGQDPVARGLDPVHPVAFDLTRDHPDNVIEDDFGNVVRLGSFEVDAAGRAVVGLYGDLRYHDMGRGLAESIDEIGTGESVWLTKELWGVGSTAPYLHDGRATTLTEAILEHGGESAASRGRFELLDLADRQALVAFLDNLVLFKIVEEE
ncbi:MAG: hypothetical protein HKM95_08380 [Inquilinus sp.]|nr:hypothetical protein [Inquilinus sp.]